MHQHRFSMVLAHHQGAHRSATVFLIRRIWSPLEVWIELPGLKAWEVKGPAGFRQARKLRQQTVLLLHHRQPALHILSCSMYRQETSRYASHRQQQEFSQAGKGMDFVLGSRCCIHSFDAQPGFGQLNGFSLDQLQSRANN